ncbi:hypothetical protein HOQ94_gp07, partial [Burkholderia phage Bp-AMP1]
VLPWDQLYPNCTRMSIDRVRDARAARRSGRRFNALRRQGLLVRSQPGAPSTCSIKDLHHPLLYQSVQITLDLPSFRTRAVPEFVPSTRAIPERPGPKIGLVIREGSAAACAWGFPRRPRVESPRECAGVGREGAGAVAGPCVP